MKGGRKVGKGDGGSRTALSVVCPSDEGLRLMRDCRPPRVSLHGYEALEVTAKAWKHCSCPYTAIPNPPHPTPPQPPPHPHAHTESGTYLPPAHSVPPTLTLTPHSHRPLPFTPAAPRPCRAPPCTHVQYCALANELIRAGEQELAEEVLEMRDYL